MFISGLIYLACVMIVAEHLRTGSLKPDNHVQTAIMLALAPFTIISALMLSLYVLFFNIDAEEDHD